MISANSDTESLEIIISCSGIEIPNHEIEQVFQPFYRMNKTEPWKNTDSGLELAVLKEIVKRLNGEITVQSANQQINFIVKLPLQTVFELQH